MNNLWKSPSLVLISSEKQTDKAIGEKFNRLSLEDQHKVILFVALLANSPGFWADLQAATPGGRSVPSTDVIDILMEKWATSSNLKNL